MEKLGEAILLVFALIIEGIVYKTVIYDKLLPLVDEPFRLLLGVGIASVTLVGDVFLVIKLFPATSE